MKAKFIIDKEFDKEIGRMYGLKEPFYSELEKDYKKNKDTIEKTKKVYQKAWNEINDDFSQYIEKETGYNWFYPEYECVISIALRGGISNWGNSNKISYSWAHNPYLVTSGIAYELILSHYFEIIKRHYSKEKLKDKQIWALAEIASMALTSLTDKAKKLWPWNHGYTKKHNYPELVSLQKELKESFLKRKNFDEYIKEGIRLVKKHPDMWPVQKKK